jgi:uncharacterized protein YbaR (Trm112 family)
MSEIPLWTMGACPACKKKLNLLDRKDKRCTDCGEFFSFSKKSKVISALLAATAVALVFRTCSNSGNDAPQPPGQVQNAAKSAVKDTQNAPEVKSKEDVATGYGTPLCQKVVKKGTSIPSSVDFTWAHNLSKQQDGTFIKTGSFTHKNAYGQTLKKEYRCKIFLEKSGADVEKVKIISLQEAE